MYIVWKISRFIGITFALTKVGLLVVTFCTQSEQIYDFLALRSSGRCVPTIIKLIDFSHSGSKKKLDVHLRRIIYTL